MELLVPLVILALLAPMVLPGLLVRQVTLGQPEPKPAPPDPPDTLVPLALVPPEPPDPLDTLVRKGLEARGLLVILGLMERQERRVQQDILAAMGQPERPDPPDPPVTPGH